MALVYDPAPRRPSGGIRPGAKVLQRAILGRYPDAYDLGIYNPRDVCGNPWPGWRCSGSMHADGRAGDDGFPTRGHPDGHPAGHALAAELVRLAEALGIQEVIWARRIWTAKVPRWRPYSGRSSHLDHVHWTITLAAAAALTAEKVARIFAGSIITPPDPLPPPEEDEMPEAPDDVIDRYRWPTGEEVAVQRDGGVLCFPPSLYRGSIPHLPPAARQGWPPMEAAAVTPVDVKDPRAGYVVWGKEGGRVLDYRFDRGQAAALGIPVVD